MDKNSGEFFRKINEATLEIKEKLEERGFKPDIVITCSRSSAIFGGILAERLQIQELLSLPRRKKEDEYAFCELLHLKKDELREKKILLLFYVISHMKIKDLNANLIDCNVSEKNIVIATYFSNEFEADKKEGIIAIKDGSNSELDKLPWANGKYNRPLN